MIEAIDLSKTFRIPSIAPGIKGTIKNLVKGVYLEKKAVSNVNFTINDGEAVAYIGPNGAGKSTTIKMLTGILKSTSGTLSVLGLDPYLKREENAKNIGVVFGQRTQLWWDIPICDTFELLKDIYEIPVKIYNDNLKMFTELLGLSEFMNRSARRLSLGQRMRADLAASLLHNPSILYLDEPTIGLDIAVKESMIGYIRKVNVERGVTVMLTSHDLKDVEGICRRIIVIDEGKLICDEQISRLTGRFAKERSLHVTLSHSDKAIKDELVKLPSISVETDDNINFTINFPKDDYTAFEIISIIARSTSISDFKLVEPDIKKVIEKIYRSELVLEDTQ